MGIWQSGLDKRILHSRRCYTEDMLLDRDLRQLLECENFLLTCVSHDTKTCIPILLLFLDFGNTCRLSVCEFCP